MCGLVFLGCWGLMWYIAAAARRDAASRIMAGIPRCLCWRSDVRPLFWCCDSWGVLEDGRRVFLSALTKRCEIILRTVKASVIYAGMLDMY